MIIDNLIEKIKELKNPTVVGLDPKLSFVPDHIKKEMFDTYGNTAKAASSAILRFNMEIIDEIYDIVPAVKPQIAMYETFGFQGVKAYMDTVAYAKEKGLIVIGDIKRGDIGSTGEAYADGHIGRVSVGGVEIENPTADFVTLNAYLGYDSIEPFVKICEKYDKGMFILVKTSNPNSGQIQDLLVDGKPVYEIVGSLVSEWGAPYIGKYGFSSIGAVVGATHKEQAQRLRKLMPNTFFLVPGYGAQGGTAEDLAVCFNDEALGAIVNSSRGIIAAYKTRYLGEFAETEHAKAARQAAVDMRADILRVIEMA
jgi:orotidine-5'-phosphate decarboxylase